MLVRLVYASRAKATLTPAQFDDILTVSRRNNPANGITGVLCTNSFIFLQMGGSYKPFFLLNTPNEKPISAGAG